MAGGPAARDRDSRATGPVGSWGREWGQRAGSGGPRRDRGWERQRETGRHVVVQGRSVMVGAAAGGAGRTVVSAAATRWPVRARSVHRQRSPYPIQRPTSAAAARWASIIAAWACRSLIRCPTGSTGALEPRGCEDAPVGVLQRADAVAVEDGQRRRRAGDVRRGRRRAGGGVAAVAGGEGQRQVHHRLPAHEHQHQPRHRGRAGQQRRGDEHREQQQRGQRRRARQQPVGHDVADRAQQEAQQPHARGARPQQNRVDAGLHGTASSHPGCPRRAGGSGPAAPGGPVPASRRGRRPVGLGPPHARGTRRRVRGAGRGAGRVRAA